MSEKAKRRRFTAAEKKRILTAADRAVAQGELSALLRQEGIYSSHLSTWRRQREEGSLAGLEPKKRGAKPKERDEREDRIVELERENAKLRARAELAEALVELQKNGRARFALTWWTRSCGRGRSAA